MRPEVETELTKLCAKGKELRTETAVHLEHGGGEVRGKLSPRSKGGWWRISTPWLTTIIDVDGSSGWTVEVRATAKLLMDEGLEVGIAEARSVAHCVLEDIQGERCRRLDLSADFVGWRLRQVEHRAFHHHWKTLRTDIAQAKSSFRHTNEGTERKVRAQQEEHWRRGKRTGFTFGKGDAVARIYDKTEHLRLGLDELKREDEENDWRRAGWDGSEDVTRVEFQLRGRLCEELEIRENLDNLGNVLDGIWGYCTHKWLRLVDVGTNRGQYNADRPSDGTRKDRCYDDARWSVVKDVTFRRKQAPLARRRPTPIPHARRLISAAIRYNAAAGHFVARKNFDARAHVREWSEERAHAMLFDVLSPATQRGVKAAVDDLVQRFDGPKEAAAYLLEKCNAAAHEFLPVRSALADEAVHHAA